MQVEYNFLNLPTKVIKPEGTIEWVYDAAGTKLSKTVTTERLAVNDNPMLSKEYKAQIAIESQGTVATNGDVTFTAGDSIVLKDGFTAGAGSEFLARIMPNTAVQVRDYCDGLEYFEDSLEAIYFDGGRVFYVGSVTERQYVLTDYQGNTRVLFRDNGSSIAEELEGYSYYPFGLEMKRDFTQNNAGRENKYLFNGNELQSDFGLGTYDFVNRHYDPAIGRFWQIDKLAEDPMQIDKSPYAFGWNNPVRYNDPDGNCPNCATAGIGAVVGGVISVGFSIYNQVQSGEDISISKTLIDGAAGVASGAVIGSGAGLVAAVGANSAAGGAMVLGGLGIGSSFAGDLTKQGLEIANGDREGIDAHEMVENAAIAMPLNMIGGIAGQGLKQAASSAIKKRVTQAVASRSTIKAAQSNAAKSLGNATKGEIKNARRQIKAAIKQKSAKISAGLGTAAQETINATVMGVKKAIAPELKHENND